MKPPPNDKCSHEARVRNTISTTAYQAEGVKIKNTIQLSVPVSHGPAVVARDEAVGSGVARQHVGDAELRHVAIVGPAARGRGLLVLTPLTYFFTKRFHETRGIHATSLRVMSKGGIKLLIDI